MTKVEKERVGFTERCVMALVATLPTQRGQARSAIEALAREYGVKIPASA